MAAIDVPNDPGFGLRREVTAEQLALAKKEHEARHEQNVQIALGVGGIGIAVACGFAMWLYGRRLRLEATRGRLKVK